MPQQTRCKEATSKEVEISRSSGASAASGSSSSGNKSSKKKNEKRASGKKQTKSETPSPRASGLNEGANSKVDLLQFLDRHFMEIRPGIHHMTYTLEEYFHINQAAQTVLGQEPVMLEIDAPIVIVGDIHGQFNDLINIFMASGRPPTTRYLFLGDYVDRGGMSVECIMLLLAYKVQYPDHIYLLRGNHECPRINKKYGFLNSCIRLNRPLGQTIWAFFQHTFNMLPICALVSGRIFCMHGGLSPELADNFDELKTTTKPIRNPFRGLVNDLMWSDPDVQYGEYRNSARGSGFMFGASVTEDFCERNNVDLIVRAHQVCFDGFWLHADRRVLTLFSAPSYSNAYRNTGAILRVSAELECQLVAFMPNVSNAAYRVVRKGRLWEEMFDPVCKPADKFFKKSDVGTTASMLPVFVPTPAPQ